MNNYSKLIASQKVQNKNSKYFLLREISNFQNNTLKSPYLFYLQYRERSESILHLKNLKSNDKWTINFYARNSECNIDCEQFKGNIFVLGGWFDNVLKTGCRIDLTKLPNFNIISCDMLVARCWGSPLSTPDHLYMIGGN